LSGIFGVIYRDDREATAFDLPFMRPTFPAACAYNAWQQGVCGLASSSCPPYIDRESGLAVVANGRLDNRAELVNKLGLSQVESAELCDGAVLLRAYQQWGEACSPHIYGDWSLAVWDARRQRLFLARDHHGCTALYYLHIPQLFAFASHPAPLLALIPTAPEMDELYLAQTLVSWPARYGDRSIYRGLRRLPPAHALIATRERVEVQRYWRLEDVPELRLSSRQEYVEALRDVFDTAVQARLAPARSCPAHGRMGQGNECKGIAVSLSGGLDSSAVAATAAYLLREQRERLFAFTSAPRYDAHEFTGQRFGDEAPLAEAVCRQAGNIDLHRVDGGDASPLQAIRRALDILGEPAHAAGNLYWILELERAARARGCEVLLTGQSGNASISWRGDPLSQPLPVQFRLLGMRKWAREQIKHCAPSIALARRQRRLTEAAWVRATAIHPDFARRLELWEQWRSDPNQMPARSPREQRYRILMPGRSIGGAVQAQLGAANGLDVRDPTADARLLAFVIAVPDNIFIDPATGMDRWLIRAAMQGRTPDEVRLNRARGQQAADLALRLRDSAGEVEETLTEVAQGPASGYVDVAHMRRIWTLIREQNTPQALGGAGSVLMRGLMAGLFVNRFYA
jgi:asparagine synthase (glutamine-hydrolysing)